MADRLDPERHPVAAGALALLGVTLVVGLIMGLAALAGARVLGLSDSSSSTGSDGEASMYLPKPEKTKANNQPEITLAPGEESSSAHRPRERETTDKEPKRVISLSASQSEVAPMQQIDLTGTYPGGEGAILQVQRFENGSWQDFPASPVSVSDQTFSTYVQTGVPGVQRFRVVDTSTGKPSNEVRVTVG